MKWELVIFYLLITCCLSCNRQKYSDDLVKIKLGKDLSNVLAFDDDKYKVTYKYIQLYEGKNDTALYQIRKIIKHDSLLFVLTTGTHKSNWCVYIWNDKGKFVKKLPIGRGHGEHIMPLDIVIDKQEDVLYVLAQHSFLYSYSLKGDFIEKKRLPNRMFMEFMKINNYYLMLHPFHKKENDFFFYIVNDSMIINKQIEKYKNRRNYMDMLQFCDDNDKYFCIPPYGNMIYNIDTATFSCTPFAVIDPVPSIENSYYDQKEIRDYGINRLNIFLNQSLIRFNIFKDETKSIIYDILSDRCYYHFLSNINARYVGSLKDGEIYDFTHFKGKVNGIYSKLENEIVEGYRYVYDEKIDGSIILIINYERK